MAVLLEVEEIARGDYSPEYGTVVSAVDSGDSVTITFFEGKVITPTKGTQLEIEQGGRFDHSPVRPAE